MSTVPTPTGVRSPRSTENRMSAWRSGSASEPSHSEAARPGWRSTAVSSRASAAIRAAADANRARRDAHSATTATASTAPRTGHRCG
jgi:hypothetical protein